MNSTHITAVTAPSQLVWEGGLPVHSVSGYIAADGTFWDYRGKGNWDVYEIDYSVPGRPEVGRCLGTKWMG